MFGIYERLRWVYLSVFAIQVVPMSAGIVWREWVAGGHSNAVDLLIASVLKIDDVCYLSIITSVVIVDIGRYLMGILITAPQDRAYERGLARGKREGREEALSEEMERRLDYDRRRSDYDRYMRNWRQRFMDALERGEHFDEVPPEAP